MSKFDQAKLVMKARKLQKELQKKLVEGQPDKDWQRQLKMESGKLRVVEAYNR